MKFKKGFKCPKVLKILMGLGKLNKSQMKTLMFAEQVQFEFKNKRHKQS